MNFNTMSSAYTNMAHMHTVKGSVNMFGEGTGLIETDSSPGFVREDLLHGSAAFGIQTFMQDTAALDEDMALPDDFLDSYYSQVTCWLCRILTSKFSTQTCVNACSVLYATNRNPCVTSQSKTH